MNKCVLIIKIGAIGDVIMSLPVVSQIKIEYPDSKITWICGKIVAPILEKIPEIDKLLIVDEKKIFSGKMHNVIYEFLVLYRQNILKNYDLILNYHVDRRYRLFEFFCFSKQKNRFVRKTERPIPVAGRSRISEHVRLFQDNDKVQLNEHSFPTFNYNNVREIKYANHFDKNTVVLAPGGANNVLRVESLRRWPIENYRELAKKILLQNKKVIIVGGKSDTWILPYFEDLDVLILIDEMNLPDLIYCFSKSYVVITHDSGPFHLAIFAKTTNVIGLFGPTAPSEFRYGTLYDSNVKRLWEGNNLSCSPCYYGKFYSSDCKKNICMDYITVEKVLAELKDVNVIKF